MHKRIKSARLKQKMSQARLADLSNVSRSAISQWESVEGSSPNTRHLLHLAKTLNVSFEWLATGSDKNQNKTVAIIHEPEFNVEELDILKIIKAMPVGKKRALLTLLRY